MASEYTPLGAILEDARQRLGLSIRGAAGRAGISEGRWRQVVTGVQKAAGRDLPVNPRHATVAAMARAVGVDPGQALQLAGFAPGPGTGNPQDALAAEITLIRQQGLAPAVEQILIAEAQRLAAKQREEAEQLHRRQLEEADQMARRHATERDQAIQALINVAGAGGAPA